MTLNRIEHLIAWGNKLTNPLLPDEARLEAAVTHTEALYALQSAKPEEIPAIIQTFSGQIANFISIASDPSEDEHVRNYALFFTIRLGLTHVAMASGHEETLIASSGRTAFSSAVTSIATIAAEKVDLEALKRGLVDILADETNPAELRRTAAGLYILAEGYQENRFAFELDEHDWRAEYSARHGKPGTPGTPAR